MTSQKEIEKELSAVERGEPRTWGQVSMLLNDIDSSGYWHRDSPSFTVWLNRHLNIFSLKSAMLWRYITAGRYLMQLKNKSFKLNDLVPTLETLPSTVSPEGVEILAKLERVLPEADFEQLLKRTLGGEVRRTELRSMWETFRPVLGGKTARGRSVVTPRVNRNDPEQSHSLMEANLLNTLRNAGSEWTGVSNPVRYEIFLHVIPDGLSGEQTRYMFPVIAMVKPRDGAVQYHAVMFAPLSGIRMEIVERQRVFADYLWLIPRTSLHGVSMANIDLEFPRGVGLLNIENGQVQLVVPAERITNPSTRRGDLASALLLRSLKS